MQPYSSLLLQGGNCTTQVAHLPVLSVGILCPQGPSFLLSTLEAASFFPGGTTIIVVTRPVACEMTGLLVSVTCHLEAYIVSSISLILERIPFSSYALHSDFLACIRIMILNLSSFVTGLLLPMVRS